MIEEIIEEFNSETNKRDLGQIFVDSMDPITVADLLRAVDNNNLSDSFFKKYHK